MHAYTRTLTQIHICTHLHTLTRIYTHTPPHAYIHTYIHLHSYTQTCINAHTHTKNTHTHSNIHSLSLSLSFQIVPNCTVRLLCCYNKFSYIIFILRDLQLLPIKLRLYFKILYCFSSSITMSKQL